MKIEHLIARYLLTHKTLSLQEIGNFRVNGDFALPTEEDKELILPENAIEFEYNPKAKQDDSFIEYIVEHTRKIKPLATSDLESFTILGKQFMNIGKPLPIEGLGILFKNQLGNYEFKQGSSFIQKPEQSQPAVKEKERPEIDFSSPPRKKGNAKWLAAAITIAVAAILSIIFYTQRKKSAENVEQPVSVAADSSRETGKPDSTLLVSAQAARDSISQVQTKPATDSFSFKVVIREYNDAALADKKLAQFKTYGHKLILIKPDSSRFLLAMPFMNPATDSTRMRDSLKVLFGGTPFVYKP